MCCRRIIAYAFAGKQVCGPSACVSPVSHLQTSNVNINHSTVSGWIKDAMRLIEPVYDLHCWQVLNTNYLNVDETTIKVLDKDKKQTTHTGYYWVYYDTQRKLALFDYQPGRGALYPKAMLHKFKGYLQTDGYDAYETFDKVEGVTPFCCWAHRAENFTKPKITTKPMRMRF
ncbi:MAG: transposase [Sphingobacteriales bacterium]|nr:transposase [Sphingobacteriales bacterium]